MSDEAPRPAANCHYCGKRIKPTKTNKAQSYCDDKCRQAAYRARIRAKADPSFIDTVIRRRQDTWRQLGYTDDLIEALMEVWYGYGGKAITATEKILSKHELIIVNLWSEKYFRSTDSEIQQLEDRIRELEAQNEQLSEETDRLKTAIQSEKP